MLFVRKLSEWRKRTSCCTSEGVADLFCLLLFVCVCVCVNLTLNICICWCLLLGELWQFKCEDESINLYVCCSSLLSDVNQPPITTNLNKSIKHPNTAVEICNRLHRQQTSALGDWFRSTLHSFRAETLGRFLKITVIKLCAKTQRQRDKCVWARLKKRKIRGLNKSQDHLVIQFVKENVCVIYGATSVHTQLSPIHFHDFSMTCI